MLNPDKLLQNAAYVIPLILSLTVHEWAHAWSAFRLGDDTAARQGRLTLNPLSHIDLVGSVLLPLMGVPFGWARPVPVNPARFGRKVSARTGMMITASAGPVSNVVLAVLCVVAIGLMLRFSLRNEAVEQLLLIGFRLNVALALFNLLPIPPLDGSRVADGLMPARLQPAWERFTRYAPLLLLVIVMLPDATHVLFDWPVRQAFRLGHGLAQAIAGS